MMVGILKQLSSRSFDEALYLLSNIPFLKNCTNLITRNSRFLVAGRGPTAVNSDPIYIEVVEGN
jgi:hypothetical protein